MTKNQNSNAIVLENILWRKILDDEKLYGDYNLLIDRKIENSYKIVENKSYLSVRYSTVEDMKLIKSLYRAVKDTDITQNKFLDTKYQCIGISMPKKFISEVLSFKNINNYINQFRIFCIISIIENSEDTSCLDTKVYQDLKNYFDRKRDVIYRILIQEYVYYYLLMGGLEVKNGIWIDTDEFLNLVNDIKKLYDNDFNQSNLEFPLTDNEIYKYIEELNALIDDKQDYNNLKKKIFEPIYKIIEPFYKVDIDYIFDMVVDQSSYSKYLDKLDMEVYEFNEFYQDELYIKLTKQPKMCIFQYTDLLPIILYFADYKNERIHPRWLEKNVPFSYITDNIKYLNHIKNKKNNLISSKYIGDQYEKFCAIWLEKNGYEDIKIVGQKGDKGIDILATQTNIKVGVQCKYKTKGSVTSSDIRILYTSKNFYDITKCLLMTNVSLTKEAIKDMEKLEVIAIILPVTKFDMRKTNI